VGPGLLSGPVRDLPTTGIDMQLDSDTKIALDDEGHLVPDVALRKLMDAFLAKGRPSEPQAMAAQLRALLQARLRQPAASEADRLVTNYQAYLEAEQQLLAAERLTQPDPSGLSDDQVRQLLAWQQQRYQLRQRMLGIPVAHAWFDEEDGNCTAVLNEWEKQREPEAEADPVEQMDRRRLGLVLEQRRNDNAQACAAQIMETMAPRG
jgi:lipase chaperone LimK